jgi:hypothetical protein
MSRNSRLTKLRRAKTYVEKVTGETVTAKH